MNYIFLVLSFFAESTLDESFLVESVVIALAAESALAIESALAVESAAAFEPEPEQAATVKVTAKPKKANLNAFFIVNFLK